MKKYTQQHEADGPTVAFAGANGRIGQSWATYSGARTVGLYRQELDLAVETYDSVGGFDVTDNDRVLRVVEELGNRGVRTLINGTGKVYADRVEQERGDTDGLAFRINVVGARAVADACREMDIKLIHLSTKAVLAREVEGGHPAVILSDDDPAYTDDAPTWYGITKALGEHEVMSRHPEGATIVRFENVHGVDSGLVGGTAERLRVGEPFSRVDDMYGGHFTDKTAIQGLARIEDALHTRPQAELSDVYHLGASTVLSPYQIAVALARRLDVDSRLVTPMTQQAYIVSNPAAIWRPGRAYLDVSRFSHDFSSLPSAEAEIDHYLQLYGEV